MNVRGRFVALVGVFLTFIGGIAGAQEVLEEITVVAQKREASLQEVPISIGVLASSDIERFAVGGDDIRILSARVANLNVESTFGRTYPRFYIRGLGNSDFALNAQQSVEMYYDEVVLSNPVIKGMPIFDVERVEVLRGPQGALWGRNATAGAVHVISRKPSETMDGHARISVGELGTRNAEGAIGGALIDGKLSGRISVLYQSQDDWVENLVTGNEVGSFTDAAARAQLLWTPGDGTDVLFQLYNRSFDGVAALFHSTAIDPVFGDRPQQRDKIALDNDRVPYQDIDMTGVTLRIDQRINDDLSLVSVTGFVTAESYTVGDVDAVGSPVLVNADAIDDLTQLTQELRLASNYPGRWNWQLGAYYFDESLEYVNTTANNAFQIPDPPGPFDLGQPGDPGFGAFQFVSQDFSSWAVFGNLSFELTERTNLTAGIRYSDDSTDASRFVGQFTPNPANLGAIPDFSTSYYDAIVNRGPISLFGAPVTESNSLTSDETTWELSLMHVLTGDVNVYARLASGYHGGVIEAGGPFSSFATAEPETVDAAEIGLKSELLGRRLRANVAAFWYDFKNQQLQGFEDTGGGGFTARLLNAEGGTGIGLEAELEYQPNAYWYLSGNVGYVDTEIEGPTYFSTSSGEIVDLDGRRFPFAPELTAAFLIQFSVPLNWSDFEFFAETDWSFRDEIDTRFTAIEEPRFRVDSYWEGGLRAGVGNDEMSVSVWGRNISDEIGITSVLSVIGFDSYTYNGPRVFGIDFSIRY